MVSLVIKSYRWSLSESSIEGFRTKFLTPEINAIITSKLSDDDSHVRKAGISVIGSLVVYGRFDRQVVKTINDLNLQQWIPELVSCLLTSMLP
jgi:hypothetical protein